MLVLSSNRYYKLNRIPKLSLDNYLELILIVFVDSFETATHKSKYKDKHVDNPYFIL